jgi:outer membrane biosynthesis protein TonB
MAVEVSNAQLQRPARRRPHRGVARALTFSLLFHLVILLMLELGSQVSWLKRNRVVAALREALVQPTLERPPKPPAPRANQPVPMLFVDVNPEQATPEPPPDTPYYSTQNTRAANPNPDKDTNVPRIDGGQTKIVKTFDTLRPQPASAPPAPTPPERPAPKPATDASQATDAAAPAPQPSPELVNDLIPEPAGELKVAKVPPTRSAVAPANEKTAPLTEREPPSRPRTLAAARQQKGIVVAPKSKQEGGVRRGAIESSLDVRASPFGAYDAALIEAVQKRWYDLLDERKYAGEKEGKVVLQFHLNQDGSVSHVQTVESSVGAILAILCQNAVRDPAPYGTWPSDMRRMVAPANFREVRFTFYY